MRKRILSVVLTVLMLAAMVPSAMAATLEEINQDEVFLKQQQRGTCTLASTAMITVEHMPTPQLLELKEEIGKVAQITEASCREAFWLSGRGLPYNFSYGEMTVGHDRLPGGQANEAVLIDLLEEHPEGIMLHAACVPHGILLTEYKDGQFYCADPSEYAEAGIIPIEEAWGTRVENSNAYWYVTSQVAQPQEKPVLPAPSVEVEDSVSDLMAPLATQETETAACLIGQALVEQNGTN